MPSLPFPHGVYELYADDDDVIGLPVARTHPKGWFLIRTDPPIMDAFDEYEVGGFLAWCLSNAERVLPMMDESEVASILARTARTDTTVCGKCGGTGTEHVGSPKEGEDG